GFTVKLAEMAMETCKNDLELAADLLQDLRDDIVLSNQHPTEYVHTDEWLKGERWRVRRWGIRTYSQNFQPLSALSDAQS
ncbi:hypothetical protein M1146_08135, partial [Patescibacteria group bacterium]|nr:hypothetical protein [Patescibacteria group bacterium]